MEKSNPTLRIKFIRLMTWGGIKSRKSRRLWEPTVIPLLPQTLKRLPTLACFTMPTPNQIVPSRVIALWANILPVSIMGLCGWKSESKQKTGHNQGTISILRANPKTGCCREATIAEAEKNGYNTAHIGKYHVGGHSGESTMCLKIKVLTLISGYT